MPSRSLPGTIRDGARQLRAWRTSLGMTQAELAAYITRAGLRCSGASVAQWETRTRRPVPETAAFIEHLSLRQVSRDALVFGALDATALAGVYRRWAKQRAGKRAKDSPKPRRAPRRL